MTNPRGMRVEAQGLSREFRDADVRGVDDVDLTLAPGEFVALWGRSGSGKTSLLSLLGGLDDPTNGTVRWDGVELASVTRAQRTRLQRTVGVVIQGITAIPRMPAWENVTCALIPRGVRPARRLEYARRALDRVGLADLAHRRPEQLSAGQRQRLSVARLLVGRPRLVLADEPTSHLDPETADLVLGVFEGLHAAGATVLLITHDQRIVARAPRALEMDEGRIVSDVSSGGTAPP